MNPRQDVSHAPRWIAAVTAPMLLGLILAAVGFGGMPPGLETSLRIQQPCENVTLWVDDIPWESDTSPTVWWDHESIDGTFRQTGDRSATFTDGRGVSVRLRKGFGELTCNVS